MCGVNSNEVDEEYYHGHYFSNEPYNISGYYRLPDELINEAADVKVCISNYELLKESFSHKHSFCPKLDDILSDLERHIYCYGYHYHYPLSETILYEGGEILFWFSHFSYEADEQTPERRRLRVYYRYTLNYYYTKYDSEPYNIFNIFWPEEKFRNELPKDD